MTGKTSLGRRHLSGEKLKPGRKQGASSVASAGMPGLEFAQTPFYRERSRCKDPGAIKKIVFSKRTRRVGRPR